MMKCDDCKYAEWMRTKAGRLHPSKAGQCTYDYKLPPLPQAYWWAGGFVNFNGGFITRGALLKDHCAYYQSV